MESLTIVDLKAEQESIIDDIDTNVYLVKDIIKSYNQFSNSKNKKIISDTIQKYMDEIWFLTMKNTEISKQMKNYN